MLLASGRRYGWIAALAVAARAATGQVVVHLGINYNSAVPPGIAVMPVVGPLGDSIQTIIQRDLQNSDRFVIVPLDGSDPKVYRDTGPAGRLNYQLFSGLGAKVVVQITEVSPEIHVVLHNVDSSVATAMKNYALPTPALGRDWRLALHVVSDAIQEAITAQRGIAATRVAYLRGSAIHVIDSDGAFDVAVPTDPVSAMSWNPDGGAMAYSVEGDNSRIMSLELATGRTHVLVPPKRDYLLLGPRFNPTGAGLVYWRSDGSDTELWAVSDSGKDDHRVAAGEGSDNAVASFSPDGRRIAFMSGRSGHPQVYIMDADGTNRDMLTAGLPLDNDTYNDDPDWSPNGLKIAFDSRIASKSQIVTITVGDRNPKYLTDLGENKHPSWAPDGQHIVFTSDRSNSDQLWVIDAATGNMRQLTHAAGASEGAWSPRLQP